MSEEVHDDAEGPGIHLIAVTCVVDYFWSQVVGGSADGFPFLSRKLQLGSQSEVPDLDL